MKSVKNSDSINEGITYFSSGRFIILTYYQGSGPRKGTFCPFLSSKWLRSYSFEVLIDPHAKIHEQVCDESLSIFINVEVFVADLGHHSALEILQKNFRENSR